MMKTPALLINNFITIKPQNLHNLDQENSKTFKNICAKLLGHYSAQADLHICF